MAKVTLTANLKKYFPHHQLEVPGENLLEILAGMDRIRPHFSGYILEDDGSIRKHVNIFINGTLLRGRPDVTVEESTSIHIMQALSGG